MEKEVYPSWDIFEKKRSRGKKKKSYLVKRESVDGGEKNGRCLRPSKR